MDTNDIPEIAVVDPDMMASMPKGLTAATGMDALTHAIEGYITKGHCTISDMFHLEAIRLISRSLRGAVQNTPEGREGMALGQYIAGMGFSNVGLGIVHSMAHGLSALYDTPHGVACAILLPVGLEYNKGVAGQRYRAIGEAMGVMDIARMTDAEAADATIAAVKQLSADVGIPANLAGILKVPATPATPAWRRSSSCTAASCNPARCACAALMQTLSPRPEGWGLCPLRPCGPRLRCPVFAAQSRKRGPSPALRATSPVNVGGCSLQVTLASPACGRGGTGRASGP